MPRGGKRKGAGRPRKENKQDAAISVRCTSSFKQHLKNYCQDKGISQNQLIIKTISDVTGFKND